MRKQFEKILNTSNTLEAIELYIDNKKYFTNANSKLIKETLFNKLIYEDPLNLTKMFYKLQKGSLKEADVAETLCRQKGGYRKKMRSWLSGFEKLGYIKKSPSSEEIQLSKKPRHIYSLTVKPEEIVKILPPAYCCLVENKPIDDLNISLEYQKQSQLDDLKKSINKMKEELSQYNKEKETRDDRKTLGRTLKNHREQRKEKLSKVIWRVRKHPIIKNLLPTDPDWYSKVEEDMKKVDMILITALAYAYDMEQTALQAVAASTGGCTVTDNRVHLKSEEDYKEIPLFDTTVLNVAYRVPRMTLAGSTTVITKVVMGKNGKCLKHSHHGEEIAIVLKGRIRAMFPDMTGGLKSVFLSEGEILHFNSGIVHQIESDCDSNAEIIAIRIIDS